MLLFHSKCVCIFVCALCNVEGGIPKRQLSMLSSAAAALVEYSMLHFTPFDATIRRTESIVEYTAANGVRMRFRAIKGALNTVLSISEASVMTCNHVSQLADEYASKGFRSLAVACTTPIPVPSTAGSSIRNGNGEVSRLSDDDIRLLRAQRPEFLGVVAVITQPIQ
jgi:magnesium-transporting ATPase (P-type)